MAQNDERGRKGLGMPLEVARAQLMENDEIKQLAETLGMELEDFVERVLFYGKNPDAEPQLHIIPDDELEELGADVPTMGEVMEWLRHVDSGKEDLTIVPERVTDSVSDDRTAEKMKAAAGLKEVLVAPRHGDCQREVMVEKDNPMGSVLKDQLVQQRVRSQFDTAPRKKKKPKPRGSR